MNWDDRIIAEDDLRRHLAGQVAATLESRARALLEQQRLAWPALRSGYEALSAVETKRVEMDGCSILVQHNPRRIVSTAAPVDKTSIEGRRCFLCPESLPLEERGIAYGEELILLCNPFPVLDAHLSVVGRRHVPQKIEGNAGLLLALARDLAPGFFVLYNGPECGASAPDHLHFQACSRAILPIHDELGGRDGEQGRSERKAGLEAEVAGTHRVARAVIALRGSDVEALERRIEKTLRCLPARTANAEPMLNVIAVFDGNEWVVYIFPRSRHRPACFYAEGDERLTVSPGAIDMGGVLVVPEREHYLKTTPEVIRRIFAEVSIGPEALRRTLACVVESPGGQERKR